MRYINLYSPENVDRARFVQMAVAVVAAGICMFVVVSTVLGIQRVQRTERELRDTVSQSRMLSCTSAALQRKAHRQAVLGRGGVDAFALQLSRWAHENRVDVESISPEGTPGTMEVALGETKLGKWNVNKVRVNGRGDFMAVMSMLQRMQDPQMPVQLESVLVQGVDSGINGTVSYNILCTVYEKKNESS